jgi:hypothetical protein
VSGVYHRLWLREEEDAAMRAYAEENGTSLNYVMRVGLRLLVELPVPSKLLEEQRRRLEPGS